MDESQETRHMQREVEGAMRGQAGSIQVPSGTASVALGKKNALFVWDQIMLGLLGAKDIATCKSLTCDGKQ